MSKAAAACAPMLTWIPEAMFGTWSSWLQVPNTMSSMLLPGIPAAASARAAATYASSSRPTWEMRRSWMPVRLTIHSSLGSRRLEGSGVLSTAGGRHLPQPVMAAWVTATPPSCFVRIAGCGYNRSCAIETKRTTRQVDAALNPGNGGGPVVAGDKMIGLAFGTVGNNIGYIVPNGEIALFLQAVDGGHQYDKPAMYDELQTLENPALRQYLALDKSVHGIVVHRPFRTEAGYPLKEWDLITAIGDTRIDDQGMVTLGDDLRVRFQYLIQSVARNGTVALTLLRGGKTLSVALPLVHDRPYLVRQLSGAYPEYFIYGPLVFSRATLEHLQSVYSPAMFARPRSIYGMFQSPLFQQLGSSPSAEREEVVIVSSPFFPDKLTAGYDNPAGGTVARLNGKSVRSLKHLVELLRDMKDEFMVIEFDQPEREALVFARQQLVAATERILTNNDVRAQGSAALMRVWQGR